MRVFDRMYRLFGRGGGQNIFLALLRINFFRSSKFLNGFLSQKINKGQAAVFDETRVFFYFLTSREKICGSERMRS